MPFYRNIAGCFILFCATLSLLVFGAAAHATEIRSEDAPEDGQSEYVAGSGAEVVAGDWGTLRFRLSGYVRYLNQDGIDDEYTDSFGLTRPLDKRQDIQLNKYNIYLFGWFMDPRFRYLAYVWTNNSAQGRGAQVVVAGNLQYRFQPEFVLGLGIGGLPGTRTVEGNWPRWLPVDNRLIADDYFRPSYTTGIWASGLLADQLEYTVMLGNNLSQLGVDAGQLDNTMDTWSGVVAWMPTTGEFGTSGGFGDFDHHEQAATRLGLHFTRSTENWQSQPGSEDPENTQIRLSDGNIVFTPGLFGEGIFIQDVRYRMAAVDAGVKYRGLALETEFYWRGVDTFGGPGTEMLDMDELNDWGYQVLASAMLKKNTWQVYAGTSTIFGEYGDDPWEVRGGVSWFPFRNQALRLSGQVIYVDTSPVGGLSLPLLVGSRGIVADVNLEVNF